MITKNRLIVAVFSLLAAAALAQSAYAQEGTGIVEGSRASSVSAPSILGPVPIGGTWIEFSHLAPGSFAAGCLPADPGGLLCTPSSAGNTVFGDAPPWTFTAPPQGANLTVTDAFLRGEIFEVFDHGVSIGSTSVVSAGGSCGDNPDDCLADPLASHGVFPLAAGAHEITIKVTASAFGVGAAYFRVDAAEAEAADHFLCYKVAKRDGKFEKKDVLVVNQFGEQAYTVLEPDTLCVPSSKRVIDPKGGKEHDDHKKHEGHEEHEEHK